VALGQVFSEYNKPEVANVPSGPSLDSTPTMRTKKNCDDSGVVGVF
jgi:hypothetical protein